MNKQEIRIALRDYYWMEKELLRLYKEMNICPAPSISQYGVEASIPKAKTNSDQVGNFVIRKDRYKKMVEKLERKVRIINKHTETIKDDRMSTVLYCLLDGMPIVGISKHLGISERNVYNIRDSIVDHIYKDMDDEVSLTNNCVVV
ncbi:DNA-binding response regulator [Cytobacillus sp. Hm23]